MNEQTTHKIGLVSAVIICMNAMFGAGIFTTPAKLATSVGPAGIITYLFVIAAVIFMALSLSKVAALYPQEGSFYIYAKQWGGHTMGVLAAGAYILGVVIALGLIAQVAAANLQSFIPISINRLGIIIICLIFSLNARGVKLLQVGQIILLGCTLFALFAVTILGFSNASASNLTPFMPYGVSSLASAISTAIFAFFGFESAASLFRIVKNPEQNVPKALIYSILIVGLIYLAFITSIIVSIPKEQFLSEKMALSDTISTVFPKFKWLATIIGISIVTALLGVLQSMTYSVSSLTYSFFSLLKNRFAKMITQRPDGLVLIMIGVSLFTLFNFFAVKSMGIFFNLVAMFIVFAFTASILTLVIKKHDKTIKQKLVTYLGLITAIFIFANACYGLYSEIAK